MRSRARRIFTAALLAQSTALASSLALAGVPRALTEQGRVFDAAGSPVNGAASIKFTLYDAPTGGAVLWSETQSVALDEGYFSAELGAVTAVPTSVWDGSTRYVGITVGTDAEMSPRQATQSVPYALVANDAVGDIHPTSVAVNGHAVIDAAGHWVGSPTGLVGPAGPAGAVGPQGTAGPQGPAGAIGPQGPSGAAGVAGVAGAVGPQGIAGPAGPLGPQGATGATGPQGVQGTAGTNGTNGAPGPQGIQGTAGTNGATGATGPQGTQGTAGTNGTNGAQGIQGNTGAAGATGPQGPAGTNGTAGALGATGPQGPAGPAGTLSGGVVGYLARWASPTTIGNGLVFDNGTSVGIGTASPGAKLDVAGDGLFAGRLSSAGGQVRRDFITYNTTALGAVPIHIKTSIRIQTNTMYRLVVEGYNYGVQRAINSDAVGYTYQSYACIGSNTTNDYSAGTALSQYCSSDGYLVLRLDAASFYYAGFSVSGWFTNPTGTAFNISAQVFQQSGNL